MIYNQISFTPSQGNTQLPEGRITCQILKIKGLEKWQSARHLLQCTMSEATFPRYLKLQLETLLGVHK